MGYWDTHQVIENPTELKIPPFVPDFRSVFISWFDNQAVLQTIRLNEEYFATFATAQWIADRYGDSKVYEAPFEGAGGPFQASDNTYLTRLKDGRFVNTGILAAYYRRNPEDKFPGLADKLIKGQLGI